MAIHLWGIGMICKYCQGHLGFSFNRGLAITEICLSCGKTKNKNKLIMALL